jgi:DNA-binding transcriptional regulator LsrR (DeoR family)
LIPRANLVLVGSGGVSRDVALGQSKFVSIHNPKMVSQKGGVGSILRKLFDVHRTILDLPLQAKNVTSPLQRFQGVKSAVGISAG